MGKRGPKVDDKPTKAQRDTVSLHVVAGTPQEDIARVLKIDPKTLRKYYRDELDLAKAKVVAMGTGKLVTNVQSGDQRAIEFLLKTQGKWKYYDDLNLNLTITPPADTRDL